MPFVRVSRDRHGYEHFYLVDSMTRRGKPSRPRVLYWFRTPPGVQVGREPFDESARRALEARYPDVSFDWDKLRKAAVPPPDVEPWRERRRVERAAKQARQLVERGERDTSAGEAPAGNARTEADALEPTIRGADTGDALAPSAELGEATYLEDEAEDSDDDEGGGPLLGVAEPPMADPAQGGAARSGVAAQGAPPRAEGQRRRRRRGGRRRRPSSGPPAAQTGPSPEEPKKDDASG